MNNGHISFFIGGLSNGGAEHVVCNLAGYLAEKGCSVDILTMSDGEPGYPLNEKVARTVLIREEERRNFIHDNLLRLYRLKKYVSQSKCEIFIVMLPVTTILLLAVSRKKDYKIVFSERGNPAANGRMYDRLFKKLSKRVDGFVFQTKDAKKYYERNFDISRAKHIIIPNAVETAGQQKIRSLDVRKKEIISVGRLVPVKNHEMLIRVFAKAVKELEGYNLTIYGEGSLRDDLQKLTESLGISDRVKLPGRISNVNDRISEAGIFVLTSNSEGMPNALMEAMAAGLPCIAADCPSGGVNTLIDDGVSGLLIQPNDADGLEAALKKVAGDSEFAQRLGCGAMDKMQEFSPELIYGKWNKFLNRIQRINKRKWK